MKKVITDTIIPSIILFKLKKAKPFEIKINFNINVIERDINKYNKEFFLYCRYLL